MFEVNWRWFCWRSGHMLQLWWATYLASWKSRDLFYFPLYMSGREGGGGLLCSSVLRDNSSRSCSFRITCGTAAITCKISCSGRERGGEGRGGSRMEGRKMKMPALLLGLWCLYSTWESAAQIRPLKAHVHVCPLKSLPYIFLNQDTLRQTSIKGQKALVRQVIDITVFHLIWWCDISQTFIKFVVQ